MARPRPGWAAAAHRARAAGPTCLHPDPPGNEGRPPAPVLRNAGRCRQRGCGTATGKATRYLPPQDRPQGSGWGGSGDEYCPTAVTRDHSLPLLCPAGAPGREGESQLGGARRQPPGGAGGSLEAGPAGQTPRAVPVPHGPCAPAGPGQGTRPHQAGRQRNQASGRAEVTREHGKRPSGPRRPTGRDGEVSAVRTARAQGKRAGGRTLRQHEDRVVGV